MLLLLYPQKCSCKECCHLVPSDYSVGIACSTNDRNAIIFKPLNIFEEGVRWRHIIEIWDCRITKFFSVTEFPFLLSLPMKSKVPPLNITVFQLSVGFRKCCTSLLNWRFSSKTLFIPRSKPSLLPSSNRFGPRGNSSKHQGIRMEFPKGSHSYLCSIVPGDSLGDKIVVRLQQHYRNHHRRLVDSLQDRCWSSHPN